MPLSNSDILLIVMLAIAIALIIGFLVVYVVEKKLNDIQIKVPACPVPVCPKPVCPSFDQIPQTNITSVTNTNTNNGQNNQTLNKSEKNNTSNVVSDTNDINDNSNNIPTENTNKESFGSIGTTLNDIFDAAKNNNYLTLRQGYHTKAVDPNRVVSSDEIMRPNADDIIKYNNTGNENIETQQIRKVSVNELSSPSTRPYAGSIREGANNKLNVRFMSPQTNNPNSVETSSINMYVPRLYMGKDPEVLGVSYASMDLETPADVDQIGTIPVNDYDGEPVALDSLMG